MIRRLFLLALLLPLATIAGAQTAERWVDPQIVQAKGVDGRVDYASLAQLGPWDDRNYSLTRDDLDLLAPNEAELHVAIPVFFRVEMRRANPSMPRTGEAQYPRSATQIFRKLHGGYQVDGLLYQKVEYRDGRFRVIAKGGETPEQRAERAAVKFLDDERRVTSPVGFAESAVKIHPRDPNRIIAGANNGNDITQRMYYSANGGGTWWAAGALPDQADTCCDPSVDWSWDGRFAHAAALGDCGFGGCEVWYYRSDDNGVTWTDAGAAPIVVSAGNNNDKEFLHVDKFPSSPFRDNLYMTWHSANVLQFSRSTNDGTTWSAPVAISGAGENGIGSDITTDRNGNVFYFWPATGARDILVRRSTNGGATWNASVLVDNTNASFDFPIPAMPTRRAWVYASADADLSSGPFSNSLYVAWTDTTAAESTIAANNHARVRVAFSRNSGATWTVRTVHPTGNQNTVDRFNPWLAVGPDGVVHIVYYDTQRDAAREDVDLFYTFSDDGGNSWATPSRLTSQQSPQIADNFEWGDYNGLDVVLNDLITVYTDNRREGGGTGDSIDIYAIGLEGIGECNSPPSSLRAWFPLDTTIANIVKNVAPSSPSGSAINGIPIQSAIVDNGYDFNGSNDYARVYDHSMLDLGTSDLSIAAWIKTTDANAMIVSKRQAVSGNHLGYLFMVNGGRLLLQLADSTNGWFNYHDTTYPRVDDGEFHHVAVTVDRNSTTGGRFYIDGAQVFTFNPSNRQASLDNTSELNIGRSTDNTNYFDGIIDEAQIYAKALTAAEVDGIYNAGVNGQCKPPEVTISCTGNYSGSYQITCSANVTGGQAPYSYTWRYWGNASSWNPSGSQATANYSYPGCNSGSFNRFEVDVYDDNGLMATATAMPVSCY